MQLKQRATEFIVWGLLKTLQTLITTVKVQRLMVVDSTATHLLSKQYIISLHCKHSCSVFKPTEHSSITPVFPETS